MDTERFMFAPEHFVRQIKHFIVHLNPQRLTQISQPIKEIGVPSFEINRHHIPFMFDGLLDKRFLPLGILYLPVYLTGTKTSRERHDLIIRSIRFIDQPGIVLSLCTVLIDGDKNGS